MTDKFLFERLFSILLVIYLGVDCWVVWKVYV